MMNRMWRGMQWLWLVLLLGLCSSALAQGGREQTAASPAAESSAAAQTTQAEAYQALAEVLENPEQRKALIQALHDLSEKGAPQKDGAADTAQAKHGDDAQSKIGALVKGEASADQAAESKATKEDEAIAMIADNTKAAVVSVFTLPKKIADKSTDIARSIGSKLSQNWRSLRYLFVSDSGLVSRLNSSYFWTAVLNLSLVIASAVLLYQGGRHLLLRRFKRQLDHWVKHSARYKPIVRRFLGIATTAAMDALALTISYFVAHAVALYVVGEQASITTQAALFLNAFVIIELLKIGVRVVFYKTFSGLRFLPGKDATAQHWYNCLSTLINVIGYGYLVVVPLVAHYLNYALSQAVATVIALVSFIYGVSMVLRNRRHVRVQLNTASSHAKSNTARLFLRFLAYFWHWIALGYFVMLLVMMLLEANNGLPYVLRGTLYTILIIGGGLLASGVITQIIGHRINLPRDWRRRMPGFEKRINTYIPLLLRSVHFVILMLVIFGVLSAWDTIDLSAWLKSEAGKAFADKWIGALIILFVAAVVWMVLAGMIEHRLSPETGSGKPSARAETLLSLFKTGLAVVVGIITAMMVLSQLGVNIGPLIAGAGVLGLAIGFGSQKLVQDIITGIFIQIENAMNTGDVVTVDGITGTAEHISIRTVSIRDVSGTYHIIPFSNVTTVSNYMRGYAYHKEEYGIAYNEDIDEAVTQLKAAFEELAEGEHKQKILEPITVAGVTELGPSAVKIRVLIKTTPGGQWAVGRAYNRLVKVYFDRAGIEIPYPHTTLYFGQHKDGDAPPANMRIVDLPPVTTLADAVENSASDAAHPSRPIISKNSSAENNQPDVDGSL